LFTIFVVMNLVVHHYTGTDKALKTLAISSH